MKRITVLTIVLVFVMLMVGLTSGIAGNTGKERCFKKDGNGVMGFKFLKQLKLTKEQKSQVAAILSKYKTAIEEKRTAVMSARETLYEVIHESAAYNEEAVRSAFKAVAAAREEQVVLRAKIFSEIKAILTPEQIAELKELKGKRTERMKERREFMHSKFDNRLDANK